MCKAKSEGGRRCASHTRPAFHNALQTLDQAQTRPPDEASRAQTHAMEAIAAHASTPTGHREISALRDAAEDARDLRRAAYFDTCLSIGEGMRHGYDLIEADIRKATTASPTSTHPTRRTPRTNDDAARTARRTNYPN